jgi:hypothetical protein
MFLEFPIRHDWRFAVVGLLPILGEASIREILHPLTASPLACLPRLLPAPHALVPPKRKLTLTPNTNARVVGVYSGNVIEHLPYFADALHLVDMLETNSVQLMKVHVAPEFDHFETPLFAPLNILTLASSLLTIGLLFCAVGLHDGPAVLAITFLAISSSVTSLAAQWSVQSYRKFRHLDTMLRTQQ